MAAAATRAGAVGALYGEKALRTSAPGQGWQETVSDSEDGLDVPVEVYPEFSPQPTNVRIHRWCDHQESP